jgi:ABC-2 type transport system permease protein
LLSPLSHRAFYWAFSLAAMARGLVVGLAVWLITLPFVWTMPAHPLWALAFAAAGGAVLGALGLLAGIGSNHWDHLAAYQNFLILPLTMLSGVFYSIHSLPPFWANVSLYNPVFLMIDGFRYGFTGASDANPAISLAFLLAFFALLSWLCSALIARGWKLRY